MTQEDRDKINRLFRFSNLGDIEDICKTFCDEVTEKFNRQQRRIETMTKELTDLRSETWKDEALQDMKAKLVQMEDDYYRGFPISEEEQESIREWQNIHYEKQHNVTTNRQKLEMGGAIGGTFNYEFVPTSIGTSGVCFCGACRSKAFKLAAGDVNKYRELKKEFDSDFEFQEIG